MTFGQQIQAWIQTLKVKLGLAETEPEFTRTTAGAFGETGFSGFTVRADVPSISISQKIYHGRSGGQGGYGLSQADRARLITIENKIDEMVRRIRKLTEFSEVSQVELRQHAESISVIERKLGDIDSIWDGYSGIERNLKELAALYDLISAHVNPFIELKLDKNNPGNGRNGVSGKDIVSRRNTGNGGGRDTGSGLIPGNRKNAGNGRNPLVNQNQGSHNIPLDWLNFIITKIPPANIPTILEHYLTMGWIHEDKKLRILQCLKGMKIERSRMKESGDWRLTPEDQARSLQLLRGSGSGPGAE